MDYCFVVRRAVSCCALVIALFCPLIAEAALSAPVSLQATAISPSQMNLRWVNTATHATSYSYTVTAIDNAGNVSAQSSPASAVTPACPALTQTYLSDFATYQVPVLPRPVLRASLIDPVFGTTITRVTDPAMAPAGTSGPSSGLRHEYARFPVLSADNSKVVVQVLGGADGGVYEVRDLVSGALLYKINPVDDPELSWHPTDPTRLFYRRANEIRVFHTDTGQAETLMSFPQ